MTTFRALLVTKTGAETHVGFTDLDRASLPKGEVLIRVIYSTLNYKDGLAVMGRPGVIRQYPMIPGIDFAGVVEESSSPEFVPGEEVVVTGCGTGETMWGGFAELASLDAKYIVRVPKNMTLKQTMGIGTAGFTAMQAVLALERHGMSPEDRRGAVLVTGASGGVGSVAVAILSQLGYQVDASTGRAENAEYLRSLGATTIVDRNVLAAESKRPLDSERWIAAIDTVGGATLAAALRGIATRGSVAACGLAGDATLNTTVFPFILRGVNLLGIDSPKTTKAERVEIWSRLARDLSLEKLDSMMEEIRLTQVPQAGERILAGQVRGRIVVRVS